MDVNNKMRLELKNFRCHQDRSFEFQDGSIILLRGASGTGKSTILNSIYWALYGKLRSIKTFNCSGKTSVKLQIGNIEIYRQKNPNLLKLTLEDEVYEDDSAQSVIDDLFSEERLWYISSYIHQKHTNPLLSSNNKDATDFLNMLSFQRENPEMIVKNLDDYIKSQNQLLSQQNVTMEINKRLFNTNFRNPPNSNISTDFDVVGARKEIDSLTQEKKRIQTLIDVHRDSNSRKTAYNEQRQQLLKIIPESTDCADLESELLLLQSTITILEQQYPLYKQYSELLRQYKEPTEEVNETDLQSIYHQEKLYQNFIDSCKQVGVSADEASIRSKQTELESHYQTIESEEQQYIEYAKWEPQIKKQSETRQKLDRLNGEYKKIQSITDNENIESDLKKLTERVREAEISTFVRKCPSCHTNLRIVAGELSKAEHDPMSISELTKLKNQLATLKSEADAQKKRQESKRQLRYQIDHLTESIVDVPVVKPIAKRDWSKLKTETLNKIHRLTNIRIIEKPKLSYTDAKQQYELNKIKLKLQNYSEDIKRYDVSKLETGRKRLQSLKSSIETAQKNNDKRQQLLSQLASIDEKLAALVFHPESEAELATTSQRLQQLQDQIRDHEYLIQYKQHQQALLDIEKQINAIVDNVATAESVRIKTINLHHAFLETVVYNINTRTNELLEKIFNKPIIFTINMFKENKQNSFLKPKFNISIQYNGCEYTNYEMLSGGEEDRISIALTLAIASMSNSPWILLDESFKFIDAELREKCLEALRNLGTEYGVMKCVLVVSHEDTEGFYDDVVDVESVE